MFYHGHRDFRLLTLLEWLTLDLQKSSSLLSGHPRINKGKGHGEIIMRLCKIGANPRGFRIVIKGLAVLTFVIQYSSKAYVSFRHIVMQPDSLGIMILRSGEVLIRFSPLTQ